MKRNLLYTVLILAGLLAGVHSQAPAPTAAPNTRQILESTRAANAKLIEQQAKTLQLLEEMEKNSQTLKTLGKRA